MERLPNVVIILARCAKQKGEFGMRFQEAMHEVWVADWAFATKVGTARRERYDRGEIRGTFSFASGYPGCPYCHAANAYKCDCGKLACWDGETQRVQCPWCGSKGQLGGSVESLIVSHDR